MQDVGVLIAFGSGVVSFFAPCIIPLVPAYIGYITGLSLKELRERGVGEYRKRLWYSSIAYMVGFSLVFVVLGVAAATAGAVFFKNKAMLQAVGGLVVMVFGLQFMGVLPGWHGVSAQIRLPEWMKHFWVLRAFLMGIIFATVWTPCVGAVLGAILTMAATSQAAMTGAVLLFAYSVGISLPFLLLSGLLIKSPGLIGILQKRVVGISRVAGGVLVLIGFLLFNNTAKWLFPWLTYDALNTWLFRVAFSWGYTIQ